MKDTTCFEETELPSEFADRESKNKRQAIIDREETGISAHDVSDETGKRFAGIERDIFTIGFFSAPKYRDSRQKPKQEKVVKMTSFAETGIETRAEILTHARYGLPTTSDLTKYLAFLKIIDERYKTGSSVNNPIQFTHYELLQKAGIERNQDRYEEVTRWLERLDNTQVIIHGEMAAAAAAAGGTDEKWLYKLFEEVRLSGRADKDGEKLKFNTVWLSNWAIKNMSENLRLPVDFETYQQLKNDVAKLLVVHLQVWLYASRKQNCFEKSYPKFCQLLGLKEKRTRSEIIRQLSSALNELREFEYISGWELLSGKSGLKIKIRHGPKFRRDLKTGASSTDDPENLKSAPDSDNQVKPAAEPLDKEKARVLKRLIGLGIYTDLAKSLIEKFSPEKLEQRIAWALEELHFKERKEEVRKPGGLLYKIINSDDELSILSSKPFNWSCFETDYPSFEVVGNNDESLANKDFEQNKWLVKQFERFCYNEALKNPQPDFRLFSSSFSAGEGIFNDFLGETQKRLGKQIYQSWFETLSFAGYSGNLLSVAGVEINRDWVMTYYEQTVKDVFQKMNLPDVQLEWIISDSTPTDANIEYYYSQRLIKNYQEETGITVEKFYQADKAALDRKFDSFLNVGIANQVGKIP